MGQEIAAGPADHRVAEEQAVVTDLHRRLDEMRASAKRRLLEVMRESGGTPQARSERESYNRMYTADIARYDAAAVGLCFGRVDTDTGDVRHIGRLGILDPENDYRTLLLDWRAPLARPFYLATTANPDGIVLRRHIRTYGRRVTHVDDEYLAVIPGVHPEASTADVAGESALLVALDRARTGRMTDIVATIQHEQDEIIRSGHRGVSVVQGGPGTGKTAVALHRAAYLLYTFREQLERSGVLIIGPNETFLDYIGQVLPSLGETGVVLRTIGDLYPGIHGAPGESFHTREVKGSEVMLDVLRTAVRDRQTLPASPRRIVIDGYELALDARIVRRARGRARSSRRPHNRARPLFDGVVLDELTAAFAERLTSGIDGPRGLLGRGDLAEIRVELAEHHDVRAALEEFWPPLTPEQVLADLFSSRERLETAAASLAEEDVDSLYREDGHAFGAADAPLLDELAEILGSTGETDEEAEDRRWRRKVAEAQDALDILTGSASQEFEDEVDSEILEAFDIIDAEQLAERQRTRIDLTAAERAAADRTWTYGHVIIDEAQELSAMAWRMVMRRTPNRWITAVGDTAQTGDPAGTDSWADVFGPYVADRWRLHELTVNYRTPAEIMALAADVLAEIDPAATVPRSVRSTGRHPVGIRVATGGGGDADTERMAGAIRAALADVEPGRLSAVIASRSWAGRLRRALAGTGIAIGGIDEAKGLEYDEVVLVDPLGIVEESPQGYNDLYVAITRATQGLAVLHTGSLPACLAALTEG